MSDRRKVLIVGWDSAPPREVFGAWRPHLPHLSSLMNRGVWGRLRSTDPPITIPAWTSMLSSRNPGQLGFYGFRNRTAGSYTDRWLASSQSVKVPRVWDVLSDEGKRSCVLNVPQTYPVSAVNGAMISSFLTPGNDSNYTYPTALKAEIERAAGGYVIDCRDYRTEDKPRLLEEIRTMTEKRHKVAQTLMIDHGPWDLFITVMMGPDRMAHGFWKYTDPGHPKYKQGSQFETCIRDYYALLDRQLGELCDLASPDTTVLVVSDHGTKRMDGTFNVNDWLIREGLLTLRETPGEASAFTEEDVDWSRTVAWAWGGYYARVFINLAGREAQGIVAPSDYESVRDDLINRLLGIPREDGEPMNTRALKPQEIYSGAQVDQAPDLLVYFDDLYWRAGQNVGNASLYSPGTEIGPDDSVHDYDGIFVMARPSDRRGRRSGGMRCIDVAPTILHELGVAIPPEMEGSIIF